MARERQQETETAEKASTARKPHLADRTLEKTPERTAGTQEHLGSDRPYEGATPEEE